MAMLTFEAALEQLEGTVSRLEGGDLPLEEALELFESGIELSRRCHATLDSAERRIEVLVSDRAEEGDEALVQAFEAPGEEDLPEDEDVEG